MPGADPIAPLIPWYANGTLAAEERERVERHLPECPSCYALLSHARAFRRQAPGATADTLLDHVEGHLLVQFAEQPDRLEAETRRYVSTHLIGCDVCADALEIVQDLTLAPIDSGEGETVPPGERGPFATLIDAAIAFWRGLSRTVLRPVPALIYLGALVLLVSIVTLRRPGNGAQVGVGGAAGGPITLAVLPPAVRLPEEMSMRGDEERPEPQEIDLAAAEGPFVLELITSIDLEDLADPDAAFRIEILAGDRVVHRLVRRGSDFDRRGRLQLLLDPRAFVAGTPYGIHVSFEKENDPRDGETVYRKSFRLRFPA